jgi:DNA polymerase III psi subunit
MQSAQWLHVGNHFLKLLVLFARHTADDAVLTPEIVINERLVRFALGEKISKMSEDVPVDLVIINCTLDLYLFATALKSQPRFSLFDVNMVLKIRKWQRACAISAIRSLMRI